MAQLVRRQESIDQTIARLETFVHRMERRYEFPSSCLADALDSGEMRETAEVSRWLTSYRTLRRLKGDVGEEAPSSTYASR